MVLLKLTNKFVLVHFLCPVLYVFPHRFLLFVHGLARLTRIVLTDLGVVDKVCLQLAFRVNSGKLSATLVLVEAVLASC